MTLISITLPKAQLSDQEQLGMNRVRTAINIFLGLESNRGKKSCIRRMFTSKGSLISNQKNIMAEIENFYSDLYASNDEEEVADPTLFQAPGIPKLTLDLKGAC